MINRIKETASFLSKNLKAMPEIGIILGSGLGDFANQIEVENIFKYEDILNFPVSTVAGHKGQLIFGTLEGKHVVAMQGRFHYYEGYSMQEVVFPVRVMKVMGVKYLFVSNAAGGINLNFNQGDLMIIADHINYFPEHPLRGKNLDQFGVRFPDMSKVYNPQMIKQAEKTASENNIKLQKGVYIGTSGPTLETLAEYNMFRIWGADAVGMSTVPEVIAAHHAGIKCFGISVITNVSKLERPKDETTHDEVQDVAGTAQEKMTTIFKKLIKGL